MAGGGGEVQPTLWVGWQGGIWSPDRSFRPMSRANNLKPLRGMAGVAEDGGGL